MGMRQVTRKESGRGGGGGGGGGGTSPTFGIKFSR